MGKCLYCGNDVDFEDFCSYMCKFQFEKLSVLGRVKKVVINSDEENEAKRIAREEKAKKKKAKSIRKNRNIRRLGLKNAECQLWKGLSGDEGRPDYCDRLTDRTPLAHSARSSTSMFEYSSAVNEELDEWPYLDAPFEKLEYHMTTDLDPELKLNDFIEIPKRKKTIKIKSSDQLLEEEAMRILEMEYLDGIR